MDIKASQTFVRCGQQKLRDVVRAVRALPLPAMRVQLAMLNKEPARRVLETLNQAVANAGHNFGVSEDKLVVKEMLIQRGPHYKRMRAVSRGMGHAILKRTSHIVITLATAEENRAKSIEPSEKDTAAQKTVQKVVRKRVIKDKKEKSE